MGIIYQPIPIKPKQLEAPTVRAKRVKAMTSMVLTIKGNASGGLRFAPLMSADPVVEKPKREQKPKQENDPRPVAAAHSYATAGWSRSTRRR